MPRPLALGQELFAQRFAQCGQLRLDIPDFFICVQQRVLRADRLRVGIAKERLRSLSSFGVAARLTPSSIASTCASTVFKLSSL